LVLWLTVVAAAAAFGAACSLPLAEGGGSVRLGMPTGRGLFSDVDLWTVGAAGSGGTLTGEYPAGAGEIVIEGITPGSWTITVEGKSAGGVALYRGSVEAVIATGANAIEITLVAITQEPGPSASPAPSPSESPSPSPSNGTVTVALPGQTGAYAVVTSWTLELSGAGSSSTFISAGTNTSMVTTDLAAGDWNYHLSGFDADSYPAFESSGAVTVASGANSLTPPLAVAFAGGQGTLADPWLVRRPAQLDHVRQHLSGSFRLIADLDLSAWPNWEPIGMSGGLPGCFTGTLDGNGKTITGLKITSGAQAGLFCSMARGDNTTPAVNSLTISAPSVSGETWLGALAGEVGLAYVVDCRVVGGSVSGTDNNIGGLVGTVNNGAGASAIFERCSSSAAVTAAGNAGGLAGYVANAQFQECAATGDVTTNGSIIDRAFGGLVGVLSDSGCLVKNSYAAGDVSGPKAAGLVGDAAAGSQITNCFAVGAVADILNNEVAGLANGAPIVSDSFWDQDSTGSPGTAAAGARDTGDMLRMATFAAWSIDAAGACTWRIAEGNAYPWLGWQGAAAQAAPRTWTLGAAGPAGGLIFYDKGNWTGGWRYLEGASADAHTGIAWYTSSAPVVSSPTAIGNGQANAGAFLSASAAFGTYAIGKAAACTQGGYSDWFLPSQLELYELLVYAENNAVALAAALPGWSAPSTIDNAAYWSSSQATASTVWMVHVNPVSHVYQTVVTWSNTNLARVRAIRGF
jgi:hypothetical protein